MAARGQIRCQCALRSERATRHHGPSTEPRGPLPSRNGSRPPAGLRARGGLTPPGPVNERENDSHTHGAYLSLNSAGLGRSSVRRRANLQAGTGTPCSEGSWAGPSIPSLKVVGSTGCRTA